jgi:uncharacterized protein (TIGR00369 family)
MERLYLSARCNAYYTPTIRVGDGEAEISIPVRPDMHHAADSLHGTGYFKVLDDAAFFAANSRVPDVWVLTASFHLSLFAPVVSGTLRAKGRVVHEGKRQIVAEATAYDDEGRVVAHGTGTFAVTKMPLVEPPAPGSAQLDR